MYWVCSTLHISFVRVCHQVVPPPSTKNQNADRCHRWCHLDSVILCLLTLDPLCGRRRGDSSDSFLASLSWENKDNVKCNLALM